MRLPSRAAMNGPVAKRWEPQKEEESSVVALFFIVDTT